MNPEIFITEKVKAAIATIYNVSADTMNIQTQSTRKEFDGDITAVMFPLLKISKKSPDRKSVV